MAFFHWYYLTNREKSAMIIDGFCDYLRRGLEMKGTSYMLENTGIVGPLRI